MLIIGFLGTKFGVTKNFGALPSSACHGNGLYCETRSS